MLVGPGAFEWFEVFDGSVYLCISDILEGNARGKVIIVGVNVIGRWGGEEEAVVECLCFVFVFLGFTYGAVR